MIIHLLLVWINKAPATVYKAQALNGQLSILMFFCPLIDNAALMVPRAIQVDAGSSNQRATAQLARSSGFGVYLIASPN